ncbi:hypothetical protein DV737_g4478, partial [Chaetothyriales sp. CBS 132003]
MSCLPLATLIRSYIITSMSSYPLILRPSLTALSFLAHAKSPILSPDTNPLLRFLLKRTFYAQFCAGETPSEARTTIASLKDIGYKGIILGHAKEVVMTKAEIDALDSSADGEMQDQINQSEISAWSRNTLATIQLANEDDFVALKFSGAGRQSLQYLRQNLPCASALEQAVHEMCQKAQERGVSLLFDAEQASIQDGIDRWTMYFAKKYNRGSKALVYGTYQTYRKSVPGLLAKHLELARQGNFILGVKLVRGAYLGSDPRELFWPSIEETHKCFNGIARGLMEQKFNDVLEPADGSSGAFPTVNLFLASHNAESVRLAQQLRNEQAAIGAPRIRMGYGQLMGMADNVSCGLVQAANEAKANSTNKDVPQAYKYLVWGTMSECMKYLLRRAQENKDAVSRTKDARKALGRELARRLGLDTMDSATAGEDANAVMRKVLTQLDQVVEHSENEAANEIAIKTVDIVKAFNDATAPWDLKKFFMSTHRPNPAGASWASIAAKSVADKNNKWIKFRPSDGVKNNISQAEGENQGATVQGSEQAMRVIWISAWGQNRPLSDVTGVLSHGPIFSMVYSPENDAVCVIFEHAASAQALRQDERFHLQHRGVSMFGGRCTVVPGLPYPEDEGIRRMASPIYERRRLTFVRSQLFAHGMTQVQFQQDIEQEVGAKNVELVWLFNTGNATVVFTSTANARRVRDQFRAKARQKGRYRDVQVSFSHDPCEKPLNLITQIQPGDTGVTERPTNRDRAISGTSHSNGIKMGASSGTGALNGSTTKREKKVDADGELLPSPEFPDGISDLQRVIITMPGLHAPSPQALQALRALAFPSSFTSTCSSGAAPCITSQHHLHRRTCAGTPMRTLTATYSLRSPSAPLSRKSTNPNAPKHHDRGPPSSESTQTDFSRLDIFQSFNMPTPATSIDACTTDGFHLNNDVKITGHDGVLLVGGEAFVWSPHKPSVKGGGKDLLQLDAKGTLTLTPDSLSLLAVLHPKPDLLLLGTGARVWMLGKATRDYLNTELGIRVDIMDTANASSAYNLLAQERGVEHGSGVGAALLPIRTC